MSMTFYFSPMSSSTRPHWALEELGVPYETKKVALTEGQQRTPEYLALNPNGKVPLLVVDGVPIFESLAILVYLGETYGVDKGLYPPPGLDRAEVLKWMAWGSVTLFEALSRVINNTSDRVPAEQKNEKAAAAARDDLRRLLGILDKALEGKEYLVGGRFTFADLSLASIMPFLGRMGVDFSQQHHVNAWVGRCTTRPALGRAMSA